MAKRVFFSFYYQDVRDFRANVVRNHWLTKPNREAAGFYDASIWEKAKRTGDVALKRLINSGINGTSSTCVLIGSLTYLRPWVRYEIMKSFKKGNSMCGVHINSIRGRDKRTKAQGTNPFEYLAVEFSASGLTATLSEWRNGRWQLYTQLDGRASYRCKPVARQWRGRRVKLSNLNRVYDWTTDDGYQNFSKWV